MCGYVVFCLLYFKTSDLLRYTNLHQCFAKACFVGKVDAALFGEKVSSPCRFLLRIRTPAGMQLYADSQAS